MPTAELEEVAAWLRDANCVTVLTGAGISTESGIPDFRGPQGLWTTNPGAEKLFNLHNYMNEPEVRRISWQNRLVHPAWTAQPSTAHLALAELERKGKLHTLVTQNIDGLHQAAGTSEDILVEIHGTLREAICMNCGTRSPMLATLERVRAGDPDPSCERCEGILKSATISFGQSLVREDLQRAFEAAETCDVFLALGTSLSVVPVSQLPGIALAHGAKVAIFNAEETSYDRSAHALLRDRLGTALPELVSLLTS